MGVKGRFGRTVLQDESHGKGVAVPVSVGRNYGIRVTGRESGESGAPIVPYFGRTSQ